MSVGDTILYGILLLLGIYLLIRAILIPLVLYVRKLLKKAGRKLVFLYDTFLVWYLHKFRLVRKLEQRIVDLETENSKLWQELKQYSALRLKDMQQDSLFYVPKDGVGEISYFFQYPDGAAYECKMRWKDKVKMEELDDDGKHVWQWVKRNNRYDWVESKKVLPNDFVVDLEHPDPNNKRVRYPFRFVSVV